MTTIDQAAAVDRVQQLMSIPGRSREEGAIIAHVREQLLAAGVPESAIEIDDANKRIPGGGQSGNLIVKLPGTIRKPRRLLMAHLDTVPICLGAKPVRQGDWFRSADPATGLGGDDRAGVSVILTTCLELLRQQLPHPPLTFFFAVQEEIGLYGARYVSQRMLGAPKLCFNWDGGDPSDVCTGATGDYAMRIEITGVPSHAGVHPELGVSAAAIAGIAIADLAEQGWHGLIVKGKKRGTSNVGVIQGGEATNVVMPALYLRAEARSHDPEFRKRIVKEYEKAFQKAAKQIRSAHGLRGMIKFSADLQYESFRLDESEPVVQAAMAAVTAAGLTPDLGIGNGGLDANWMTAHGFPTVTLGCGQDSIHTAEERLHIPSYLKACEIAVHIAQGK